VVALGVPFHWMTEHGKKLVPVTVRGNCGEPAVAPTGASNVAVDAGKFVLGAVTEKGMELERAKPFDTVMGKEPWVTASENGMIAVRYGGGFGIAAVGAGWTNVVGRGEPFQFTTDPPFTKFVPFTFRMKPLELQSGAVGEGVVDPDNKADTDVIVGAGGWLIVKVAAGGAGEVNVVPPPGPVVNTTT